MRSLNPLEGEFYREALQVSRSTREMFCLMEGRHVHPSTLYPGGVGTTPTVQLFTDYLTRLMRYVEFMKRVVPMHDDLFDFFYEALPGYEEVGRRRADMVCWGSLNDPEHCDFKYENMADWGRKMFVRPGVIRDGQLLTNSLPARPAIAARACPPVIRRISWARRSPATWRPAAPPPAAASRNNANSISCPSGSPHWNPRKAGRRRNS